MPATLVRVDTIRVAAVSSGESSFLRSVRESSKNRDLGTFREYLRYMDLAEINLKAGRTYAAAEHTVWALFEIKSLPYMEDFAIRREDPTKKTIVETTEKLAYDRFLKAAQDPSPRARTFNGETIVPQAEIFERAASFAESVGLYDEKVNAAMAARRVRIQDAADADALKAIARTSLEDD